LDDPAGLVIGTFETKKVVLGSCNQLPKDDDAGCLFVQEFYSTTAAQVFFNEGTIIVST